MGLTSSSFTRVRDSERPGVDPPYDYPDYVGTRLRAPKEPLVLLPHTLSELTGPVYGDRAVGELDHDLTRQHAGRAARRADHRERPCAGTGREARPRPADRDLAGERRRPLPATRSTRTTRRSTRTSPAAGRCLTDDDGEYRFVTVKPGAYPWRNHPNAWRPNHIHFSLFGRAFTERLVTQMYFPGDPLFPFDPIFNSIPDAKARERLVSRFELDLTEPDWALGFRFDIVVGGRESTPFEEPHDD